MQHLPSPAWADFTLLMKCTPESGHCHSVFSVMFTTAGEVKFILFIYLHTIQSFERVCVIVYKLCWSANIYAALFRIVHFLCHFKLAKLVIFRVRSLKIDRNSQPFLLQNIFGFLLPLLGAQNTFFLHEYTLANSTHKNKYQLSCCIHLFIYTARKLASLLYNYSILFTQVEHQLPFCITTQFSLL